MTLTTIILQSDDIVPVNISGLTVRVFTTTGTFVTSGSTDSSGHVVFDLPDADYDLTFYKVGVSPNAGQPQRITVSAGDTDVPPNTFKVVSHITSMPESSDPTLCTISGSIRGADGSLSKDIRLVLGMDPEVAVISGLVIAPQDIVDIIPDDFGYYEFTLLRKMKYRVYFPQLVKLFQTEPAMVNCIVPDLPALNLADFLFPIPLTATFASTTLSMHVGDPTAIIDTTITYSDGSINQDGIRPSPPFFTGVSTQSDNIAVATVSLLADQVFIVAIAPGTANITITRQISTTLMAYDPIPTFVTQTLVVTVS